MFSLEDNGISTNSNNKLTLEFDDDLPGMFGFG